MNQFAPESQEEGDFYQGYEPEPETEPETVCCFKCAKQMYQVSNKLEENICKECNPPDNINK